MNPHDITQFPFSFDLPYGNSVPANFPPLVFPPPLSSGSVAVSGPGFKPNDTFLPALSPLYGANYACNSTPLPCGWNYPDAPNGYNSGLGKPDLQSTFQQTLASQYGIITGSSGWLNFLNYYFWMQSCVDIQVGRVLSAVAALPKSVVQPIILFLSDHGDYGGSHSLHAKGGALYDEAINVPLFISFPKMRTGVDPASTNTHLCSSVDILPFLYALALGSDTAWRNNPGDPIYYLNQRESIMDAVFAPGATKYY